MYLEYPKSIKSGEYCFKLNTDDHFDATPISNYLKSKGIAYKKSKTQSKVKLMGWHVYKIKAEQPIKDFEQNIAFCEQLFKEFEP